MRAGSSLSRWRLATRTSVAASMRSTSTLVIVFQKARVVFGSTRCFGSPSSETMATSLAPTCTISKCSAATAGCVLANSSALSAAISARATLTTSAVRRPAVVERDEAARAEQTLEPAIAREECPLVVLDDNLELEQHDTISNSVSPFHVSLATVQQQVAGRIPRRGHGPALEPAAPRLRAWLRPRRSEDRTRRCQALGLGAKGGIRAGAERLDACSSGRHLGRSLDVSWRSREAAGFPFAWLA